MTLLKHLRCVTTRIIADAAASGGCIVGSGCEVAVATPKDNIQTMVVAGRGLRY